MINNTPLRFTTLHLAQRFLIDEDTFIIAISLIPEPLVQVFYIQLVQKAIQA